MIYGNNKCTMPSGIEPLRPKRAYSYYFIQLSR